MLYHPFCSWEIHNFWMIYVMLAITFVCIILLSCFSKMARRVPVNYLLLLAITLAQSYIVSDLCCRSSPMMVLTACLVTSVTVGLLTLYACLTKRDFSVCWAMALAGSFVMTVMGIFMLIFHNRILQIFYCSLGVLVYSFYLIYDT